MIGTIQDVSKAALPFLIADTKRMFLICLSLAASGKKVEDLVLDGGFRLELSVAAEL